MLFLGYVSWWGSGMGRGWGWDAPAHPSALVDADNVEKERQDDLDGKYTDKSGRLLQRKNL